MIQFNLLPDIKIEYLRAARWKRLVTAAAVIIGGASIALLLFMCFTVYVFQKKNINDLTRDIKTQSENLAGTTDLNKILTVQSQLSVLDQLHGDKVAANRLFGYMQQVTPSAVTITQLDVDFEGSTMEIQGKANDLAAVNTYIDTLKFTTLQTEADPDNKPNAFSDVVLTEFTRSDGVTYKVTLAFDPVLFDSAEAVALNVPNIVTTRSVLEKPEGLFSQPTNESGQ